MASMRGLNTSVGLQGTASLRRCECENARKRAMCNASYSALMDLSDYDFLHFVGEKKKRLKLSQVKRLEKSFEVANRLEPETKIQLAKELGLHPRQIAVWFQNRRARCKTKQVEKDFDALKQQYDALKSKYDILLQENKKLKDKGSCSGLSTNSLDQIGGPNDLVYIGAVSPQKSFDFEIEPKQNSADNVLNANEFPMDSSVKPKICKKCSQPLGDIYPTTAKELELGGYCSVIDEAAISVFEREITPSPRFAQMLAAASDFSPVTVDKGSSIGEPIANVLETCPLSHESNCMQETPPEVKVYQIPSLDQAEETCHILLDSLDEQDPLMLWDYSLQQI